MHVLDRFDADRIAALHERGEFFWLDLEAPAAGEIDELGAALGLPPFAVEDTREFGQRAKIDDYGDRLLIVFYAAVGDPGTAALVETHLHLSARELVTVHRDPCPPLREARAARDHTEHGIVYRILDEFSESTVTLLRRIEQEVAGLEARAFERPSAEDRRRITQLRGQLFRLLQIVVPERDMLAAGTEPLERVLAMEDGQARHPVHDIRDDLVLATNLITYCRELLAEALDVHLQATSNRLNEIATRLTLMATFFVPLTLITSFFGQNFGWLVDHVDGLTDFLIWGIGALLVPTVVIWVALRRAGYLDRDGQ